VSGSDLLIRPATPADAPALRAILHDTFESTWRPQLPPAAAEAFRAEDRPAAYVADRGLHFIVAERAGEVAGFVDWDGDFVNALHVAGRHARTGVGRALIDHAEAEIARAAHPIVRLETDTFNTRSRAFYVHRGYREVDSYPDHEWGGALTTLLLVKALR
jgi:GNAT superfamily N-acetyltransferase